MISIPRGLSFHVVMVLVLVFSVSFRLTLAMLNFAVSVEMVRNGDFALFLEDAWDQIKNDSNETKCKFTQTLIFLEQIS